MLVSRSAFARMKTAWLALCALLLGPDRIVLSAGIQNPLIQQRADPHIFRQDSAHFYFTATVPEYDRIIL